MNAQKGKEQWHLKTEGAVNSPPVIDQGVLYFGSWDNHLYALDLKSARVLWWFKTDWRVDKSPAVADGVAYLGTDNGNLYAIK